MTANHKSSKKGVSLVAFAIGALAGAVAGILLAPKPGKKTRADIKMTMLKIKDEAAEKLSHLQELTKEKYDEIVNSVVEHYYRQKELTSEQASDIKATLSEAFADLKKIAKQTKDAIKKDLEQAGKK